MFVRVARAKMAGPALSRLRQIADTGAHKQGRISDANVRLLILVLIVLCIAKMLSRVEGKARAQQTEDANVIFTISAMIVLCIAMMLSRVEGRARVRQMAALVNAICTISAMIAQCIAKMRSRVEGTARARQKASANAILGCIFPGTIAPFAHHTISAMIVLPIAKMLSRVEGTGLVRQMVAVANVMLTFLVKIAQCAHPILLVMTARL